MAPPLSVFGSGLEHRHDGIEDVAGALHFQVLQKRHEHLVHLGFRVQGLGVGV